MNKKIEIGCIYWLNGDLICSYLGGPLTKTRPFICIDKINFYNKTFYIFIYGTSQKPTHGFKKYCCLIKQNQKNRLNMNTYFQCNLFFVIEEEKINEMFEGFIGKTISKNWDNLNRYFTNAHKDKVCLWLHNTNERLIWHILKCEKDFKFIWFQIRKRERMKIWKKIESESNKDCCSEYRDLIKIWWSKIIK